MSINNSKKKYLLHGGLTRYNSHEKKLFQLDNEGLFSITSAKISEELIKNITHLFGDNRNIVITDATASVGGNAIPFILSKKFVHVNGVEINKERCEMLSQNILIKKEYINGTYQLYNCSFLDIKNTLSQDIIFIDPPWGGPDYYKLNKIKLFLDNINLGEITENLFKDLDKLKYVIIKTPKNFDIVNFNSYLSRSVTLEKIKFAKDFKKIDFFLIKRI